MNSIVILLILAILGILLKIANRAAFIRGKKIYWMIGSYIAVLLIAMVLHFFILEKSASKAEKLNMDQIPRLEHVADGTQSIETIAPYLVEEYTFDYEKDELTIYSFEANYSYVPVLIERMDDDEGDIKVNVYQVPTIIEGVDVTEQMEPLVAELLGEELYLGMDGYVDIDLNVYKNDFPMRQFTGETFFTDDEFRFGIPNHLVHVRIPGHIKLIVDDDVIDYYVDE